MTSQQEWLHDNVFPPTLTSVGIAPTNTLTGFTQLMPSVNTLTGVSTTGEVLNETDTTLSSLGRYALFSVSTSRSKSSWIKQLWVNSSMTTSTRLVLQEFQPESSFDICNLNRWEALSDFRESLLERFSELGDRGEQPIYEPDAQSINWDRLQALRGVGAHESEDLYSWYAQKED